MPGKKTVSMEVENMENENVDWLADVRDIVRGLKNDIEALGRLSRDVRAKAEKLKERNEDRVEKLEEDRAVLPVPMYPRLDRMMDEVDTAYREFAEFVDALTAAHEEMGKSYEGILSSRLFRHPLAFARMQKWEAVDYMDRLHWLIYARGPITDADLKRETSPYSENLYRDCLETLKGMGWIEVVDVPGAGHPERGYAVPRGPPELSLVDMYFWKHRRAALGGGDGKKLQRFEAVFEDFERDDGSSAIMAGAVADILDESNTALSIGAITHRFNKRFNMLLKEMGRPEIKRSEGRILGVLETLEARGFAERINSGAEERWTLDRKAYAFPEAIRAAFESKKRGKRPGRG